MKVYYCDWCWEGSRDLKEATHIQIADEAGNLDLCDKCREEYNDDMAQKKLNKQ